MRVIITGDRSWRCDDLAKGIVGRLVARYGRENLVIVHGAASGVDMAFEHAAVDARVTKDPHPADWRLGNRAGPIRNGYMVKAGAGLCIAVHRFLAKSKGTKDCARQAIAAGIPTYLIDSEEGEPVRLKADDPRLHTHWRGAKMLEPGFYGDNTDLIYVTRSGRIWLVEKPDEGPDVLRELPELPKGVESWQTVYPPEFEQQHLARIQAAGGATWMDWPPQI